MAVTVSSVRTARNTGFYTVTDVTLDSKYLEGGEPLTAEQLGLAAVDDAFASIKNGSESEAVPVMGPWYDKDKSLLRINDAKTQKELASEKDVSKVVVRVLAFGKARSK